MRTINGQTRRKLNASCIIDSEPKWLKSVPNSPNSIFNVLYILDVQDNHTHKTNENLLKHLFLITCQNAVKNDKISHFMKLVAKSNGFFFNHLFSQENRHFRLAAKIHRRNMNYTVGYPLN